MNLCLLYLTCANDVEADKISVTLLKKKLVFCIKKFPVSAKFLWQGKIDSSKEVLLIMDSIEENFKKVEKEVSKLHSYQTFVLVSSRVNKANLAVGKWVKNEL